MYFLILDLLSEYIQRALEEMSQNLTAFIKPLGMYNWKILSIGLASAPGAFQNLNELILAGLYYVIALVYLDDVTVFGGKFHEHLKRLEMVFQRLAVIGLRIKGSEFNFFQKRVKFLGHNISDPGVEVDPQKVRAVQRMKEPSSLKNVRAFLGFLGYY